MNRLVIIGNGFDLAHGLKTSYSDFIMNYLLNAINHASIHSGFSDENISLAINHRYFTESILKSESTEELLKCIYKTSEDVYQHVIINPTTSTQAYDHKGVLVSNRNNFLSRLLNIDLLNWMDIEYCYYQMLVTSAKQGDERLGMIKRLDKDFEKIKGLLYKYLLTVGPANPIADMYRLVGNTYSGDTKTKYPRQTYKKSLFLNFNYTETIKLYSGSYDKDNTEIINIHGSLSENEIIFGYGDETGENYALIENLNRNIFLRNVKSFGYLSNTKYGELMAYIDNDEFEVLVWGHSCGITDRTLLKQVVEHSNCKSIRIFYHRNKSGSDDFLYTSNNLSRHFSNKYDFRKKVYNKTFCDSLPQFN